MSKIKVAVIYGGVSGEHEVSLMSALSVCKHLDKALFDVVPIAIDKDGQWWLNDIEAILADCDRSCFVRNDQSEPLNISLSTSHDRSTIASLCDVVFPVLHGPLYEDGTLQGLLALSDCPFVGCGVLSSAISMDKYLQKALIEREGVPVAQSFLIHKQSWDKDSDKLVTQIQDSFALPLFVKPNTLGSSVAIDKVKDSASLRRAIDTAFEFDQTVLVEEFISGREVELAVLEDIDAFGEPLVSVVGEITVRSSQFDFYSYEAKYDPSSDVLLSIPADLSESLAIEAKRIAAIVFQTLRCQGMARVDLFFDPNTESFYFNEANTIPGFTTISMYPQLWEASGISYADLLTRLIRLAFARFERDLQINRNWFA